MNMQIALLAAVVGYLFGSISFARIVNRIVAPDEQITGIEVETRSKEKFQVETVGGTSISIKLGAKYGGLTALLDMLKVALPTLAFRVGYPGAPYFLITAAMGLIGHNWPIYHRFKGGRGLSAIYGGLLVIDFVGSLITSIVGMVLGVAVIKDVFISYLAGLWLMIPWLWFRTHNLAHLAYIVFVNVIFLVAMIPEIRMMQDLKRRGMQDDMATAMEATPMTRGIKKIAQRFGLHRDPR
jgi:glycerol-3-phosphate acyltransferase PlsY